MALTKPDAPVIPTLDEIMQAHKTLGDLLGLHHAGMNPPMPEEQSVNKLMPVMPKPTQTMRTR